MTTISNQQGSGEIISLLDTIVFKKGRGKVWQNF